MCVCPFVHLLFMTFIHSCRIPNVIFSLCCGFLRVSSPALVCVCVQEEGKSKKAEVLSKMVFTTSVEDAHDCDLIIEAIVERMDVKLDFYKNLSG